MRRGRKCRYKNCEHNEGGKKSTTGFQCKFYAMPKDPVRTSQWLRLGSVHHLTPKRITAFNCYFCSCHFPNGKENGPEEFVEECDWDEFPLGADERSLKRPQMTSTEESPAAKKRRVLTPSTKSALDGLMLLAADHVLSPKYSPKRMLWKMRGTQARGLVRRTLSSLLDESSTQVNHNHIQHSPPDSSLTSALHIDDTDVNNNSFKPRIRQASTPLQSPAVGEFNHSDQDEWFSDLGVAPLPSTAPSSPAPSNEKEKELFYVNGGSKLSEKNSEMPTHRSIGIQCNRSFLYYEKFKKLPEKDFAFYTGVTQTVFEIIYTFIGGDEVCDKLKYHHERRTPKKKKSEKKEELTNKDYMFLTLLRLRRGFTLADIKLLFNISKAHAARIAYTWIRFLSLQFSKLDGHMFTSAAAQNQLKPKCFEPFPDLRVIIDATEFKIQHPRHFQQQNNTFSQYKNSNTVKFLIGTSCFGGLSFLSEGYEGSMSDRKLVIKSGLLDLLEPNDVVMADRGFDIEDLCDEKGVQLLIPAFPDRGTHFTARELYHNRAIAVSRIHVETFIGKIKQFRLIRYVIPNSMLPIVSDLVKVCAYLVNFQQPFIKKDNDIEVDEFN